MSRARADAAGVPARRGSASAPIAITDNLKGRAFDPPKVAREIAFLLGPEILKRLNQRRTPT